MAGPHNVVQVYLGWANSVFNERGVQIANLSELHNGHLLFELLHALGANRGHELEQNISGPDGKSSVEAVAEVFRWLAVFGVKLSASASDVANGSMKALLDVLWEMILHLTIHSPERKPAQRTESIGAKLLMEWCSRMLSDVTFDYRKSIAENINKEVLHRLINKCCDAASSSPKVLSSSFYTAVTEAESRLGVSSMLLRTSNDAAAGYGLMVYLALLRRKVELAASGRPLLKVDDFRKDAVQRAASDASVRQQLKLQQERTQQVLKDLENQLDSFKKLRQDSGVVSQSKSSADLSSTAHCLDTSRDSASPRHADDDTLRASHASFDTALQDALSVDLSGSFAAQVAHAEAAAAERSVSGSCRSSSLGADDDDVAVVVAGRASRRATTSSTRLLQSGKLPEAATAAAAAQPELAGHAPERVTYGRHAAPAGGDASPAPKEAAAPAPSLSSAGGAGAAAVGPTSRRHVRSAAAPADSSVCSSKDEHAGPMSDPASALAERHGQLSNGAAAVRGGEVPGCADASDERCRPSGGRALGCLDADATLLALSGQPSPYAAPAAAAGDRREAARVALCLPASAGGGDATDDGDVTIDCASITPPPEDERRERASDCSLLVDYGGGAPLAHGGGCYARGGEAPDLLFSLLAADVGQSAPPGLPQLESTTYAESEDFLLAWLTSTPDDGLRDEATDCGGLGPAGGIEGTAVDDSLMTALDKIGRRSEAALAQLQDLRRRELELLRRLAERDDLVLRLHRSLLLLSQRQQQPGDGLPPEASAYDALVAPTDAGGGDDHRDAGNDLDLDAELERYTRAVAQLHDELARCRIKVVAPLQDENRLLRERLRLQAEQHAETCRALRDDRVAQERLIVSLQLEMSRFDRLLTGGGGAGGGSRLRRHRPSPGIAGSSGSGGGWDGRPAAHRDDLLTGSVGAPTVATADVTPDRRRVTTDSLPLPTLSPAAVGRLPAAAATVSRTGGSVTSGRRSARPRRSSSASAGSDGGEPASRQHQVTGGDRPLANGLGTSAGHCNDNNDDGTRSAHSKPGSERAARCEPLAGRSASSGDATGLTSAANGVTLPSDDAVAACEHVSGDAVATAAGDSPAAAPAAEWWETVMQELARVRGVFGATAHVDDGTIIRAAFNLLNESISQHVASPDGGGAADAESVERPAAAAAGLGRSVHGGSAAAVVGGTSLSADGPEVVEDQQPLWRREEEIGRLQHEIVCLRRMLDSRGQSGAEPLADGPAATEWSGGGGDSKAARVSSAAASPSSPGGGGGLPAGAASAYCSPEAARAEIERLRLKEQAMNHEFASKIAIMDDLLRAKIEEVHLLQDANLVLASQRDRHEMQQRQSEQECEALRALLKQYDDQARLAAAASAAAASAAAELLLPTDASEDHAAGPLAVTVDEVGGHGRIGGPSAEVAVNATVRSSASPKGGQLSSYCSDSPVPSDPVLDRPLVGGSAAVPAGTADRALPADHVVRELSTPEQRAGTPRALSPKSSVPLLNGLVAPHEVAAVPRPASSLDVPSGMDINDAIINELAALNMVTADNWTLPPNGVENGDTAVMKASSVVVSRAERLPGAGEHRRLPASKGVAGGIHELGGRVRAPAITTASSSVAMQQRGVSSARQPSRVDSMRSTKLDSESLQSKVKPRLPATSKRPAARDLPPSSRSGVGSALRRYEDGGPNPPALFPVLMEPSRRSRKL